MITSMDTSMAMQLGSTMQRPPPPPGQDVFKLADSDGDGQVSSTELTSLVEGIAEVTGTSLNVEETLSNYDANGDGGLSGNELFELLSSQGFMPQRPGAQGDDSGSRPPPPPPADQAVAAYQQNSGGDDRLQQLIALLQDGADSSAAYAPLEVTA